MRAAWGAFAALAALPAAAQEGGVIRTGEHDGFTRVVMVIEPTTEWSLETASGEAVIFFPGRALDFSTDGVWQRIPRTRVTAIAAEQSADGARVTVGLGCECRISASFVGARYLALDVADRDATRATAANVAIPPEPDPAVRERREAGAVAAAEQALLAQITRAADQGIVLLTPQGPPEAEAKAPPPPAPRPASARVEAADPPSPAAAAAAPPTPPAPTDPETLAELALIDQIEAISVYDRDSATLAAQRPDPPLPEVCLPDDALDVAAWSSGAPLTAQTPALMRAVVGEFDRPDTGALRDLARLYVRFGFGAEAESLLTGFDAAVPDGALIADLARAVEGRAVAPDGPLAAPDACPGRHGLWLALGGAAPAFHDAAHFATVQAAFADMPPDLRTLLGPLLAGRLIDAGRPEEARLIHVTAIRPGAATTVELDLIAARLAAAEGRTAEATALMRALAESNAHNATDALIALARLALVQDLALPDRLVTDLRAAALTQRGDAREPALRGLLIEALAARGELPAALAEVRAAQRDLPSRSASFAAIGVAALVAADPATVSASVYAETALAAADLVPTGPAGDPARRAIAARLTGTGLANAALGLLAPPLVRNDGASRRLAAEAYLALGAPASALAVLDGLDGPEALGLRAAALARSGAPEAALALLAEAGADAEAARYAWSSGDWTLARAAATDDAARAAMAGFMAARDGTAPRPAPSDEPAPLTPEAAFEAPLPALDRPSLGAARTLLATGRQVGGFVGALLEDD